MSLHYYLTIPHLDRPSSKLARYSTYSTNTSERENKTPFERWQWVLPRPKAVFLQELCFEDTVQLRPPQKKHNLINDIDKFCCIQKIQASEPGVTWSWSKSPPEKQPVLPARSRPCSFAEALLMFPSLCIFLYFVFLCCCNFIFAKNSCVGCCCFFVCVYILAIAKIQIQKSGKCTLIKYVEVPDQITFIFLALKTQDFWNLTSIWT